ncbi:hypothetical protein DFR52_10683 [Hoeflea marina]|uniref:Uncharacterized protein n=1 Tax=Hoeflea marina TaxID=274592 RepID=A0A317PDT7_9HYPH|nr:hypothetical protein [Hoeflea marina]PWV97560.1 hypothetical protein DFR52_10683 [Hoeflea marina]
MSEPSKPQTAERRLADIVREVKIASADRGDVVVDMRDADLARLELLADELRPVFADIDPADDRFDFGVSSGQQPRLWIDAVAHVHMGRDRRVFRFVRDTRLGRVVMSETSDLGQTADLVGRYVAERVIERERILAGDFEAYRDRLPDAAAAGARPDAASDEAPAAAAEEPVGGAEAADGAADSMPQAILPPERRQGRSAGLVIGLSWFILGCVAGVAALVGAFWDRIAGVLG